MPKFKQWEILLLGILIGLVLNLPPIPKTGGYNIVEKQTYNLEEQWENAKSVITISKQNLKDKDYAESAEDLQKLKPLLILEEKLKKYNTLEEVNKWELQLSFVKNVDMQTPQQLKTLNQTLNSLTLVKQPNPLKTKKPKPIIVKAGKSNWQIKLERQREIERNREKQIEAIKTPEQCNSFPYGQCTWLLAEKRCVPWRGNAGTWAYQAQSYGYEIGYIPRVGAILVTQEGFYGHVSYVEIVNETSIVVSEMNYVGWGIVNYRTLPYYYGVYIYERG